MFREFKLTDFLHLRLEFLPVHTVSHVLCISHPSPKEIDVVRAHEHVRIATQSVSEESFRTEHGHTLDDVRGLLKATGELTEVIQGLCPLVDEIKVTSTTHGTEFKATVVTQCLQIHACVSQFVLVETETELPTVICGRHSKNHEHPLGITCPQTEQVTLSELTTPLDEDVLQHQVDCDEVIQLGHGEFLTVDMDMDTGSHRVINYRPTIIVGLVQMVQGLTNLCQRTRLGEHILGILLTLERSVLLISPPLTHPRKVVTLDLNLKANVTSLRLTDAKLFEHRTHCMDS